MDINMEDNASASSLQWDMLDLADRLRQERLFVSSEQEHLKELNAKVVSVSSCLAQKAWIMVQQRANLNRLILARPDCPPSVCCQRAIALEGTQFIDGDKELPFQDCLSFGEFMQTLRTSPHLLAACLAAGDRLMPETMPTIINTLYGGLFGSCLLPEDKLLVLRLLRHLTQIQLVPLENPRRMLRHGSSALARMYALFHEGLFSAKIFLTAALHDPIMQLLMEDESFLDIDPDKAVVRFAPDEQLKKFGKKGTPEYDLRLHEYRSWTVVNLVGLVQHFVVSLRENMHCFPTSIRWLVRQISGMLSKSGQLKPKEVFDICVDLIFSFLICPAIVNPEQHGITDAPVSYIARFNLIQVAQILQVLASRKYQDVDPKVWDLYSQFDKDILSSLVDGLLEGAANGLLEEPVISESSKLQGLSRSAALLTEAELYGLVNFLQMVQASTSPDAAGLFDEAGVDRKLLAALLAQLPPTAIATAASFSQPTSNMNGNMSSPSGGPAQGPSSSGNNSKLNNLSPPHAANGNGSSPDTPNRKASIIGKGVAVAMSKTSKAIRSVAGSGDSVDENLGNEGVEDGLDVPKYSVLVIPFSPDRGQYVGLLPEQKVLNIDCEAQKNIPTGSAVHLSVAGSSSVRVLGIPPERSESLEKRTRFSLSHDEGSIGNTSDNLEAVSEAASNHSVASSLELENEDQDQNDNLSDMVSANVSGRGTPNISGRDTPSSQITEGDEGARNVAIEPRPNYDLPPPPPPTKQSRSDIDDKFGKFEIKKLLEGDETTSLVSDTWSTDVLASDSELIEQSDRERERERERNYAQQPPLLPLALQPPLVPLPGILPGPPGSAQQSLIDMSETASEAWSTDVLASDSERMLEIDTDDTSSVARSDDTARSEVESRGEPEGGDDTPPLSSAGAAVFRPIRDEGRPASVSSLASSASGMVPPSPTRSDTVAHHSWNVTGRGGGRADYRRRTLEYIDNNARAQAAAISRPTPLPITHEETRIPPIGRSQSVPVSPPLSAVSDPTTASPLLRPEPSSTPLNPLSVSASSLIPVPSNSTPSSSNASMLPGPSEVLIDIDRGDEAASQIASHASTASLTSSSSSAGGASGGPSGSGGSSSAQPPPPALTSTPTPDLPAPAPVLANGSICGVGAVPRTGIATGAIPKSISFDKTAERGDKELLDDDQKHKRGFFRNFKLTFNKNRRGKSLNRSGDDMGRYDSLDGDGPHLRLRRGPPEEEKGAYAESSEDILAKYRRKPSSGADSAASESSGRVPLSAASLSERDAEQGREDERLFIDPNNVEASYAFKDAKRKLRMVLSTADLHHVPWRSQCPNKVDDPLLRKDNELIAFLKMQLAEAINLQDRALAAHLHETLRCIKLFNNDGCQKLFHSLKEDYRQRTPYTAYLVRCRQGLLSTLAHLERMIERIRCEGVICNRCIVSVCVRMFLERREGQVNDFTLEFQQLTLADEKTDLLERFLLTVAADMERDPFWSGVNKEQLDQARTAIEQAIISRVYPYALYPNGEGDMLRDKVLHNHMKKLSEIITPNHKDIDIAKMFHYECPWPSAQAEIASISAYKTPQDKLQCVSRCATTIMNLLKMVQERNVPAADDLVPVLVFVLIKANPPALLSTVQYVNTFYGSRLEGEEHYWWTQFCSAIEYIKTLDYRD
ncbi:receptor-mediated endocytosis protein 6 homolog isoform X1 [Frankliniella occidentalis]|uniref:Receptor-mediated endocytosis protein 6 homolog n=2 Tax=Frankliniella occidentalis TaxID=133901 RepID=A0A9C6U1Q0_FRAOC|nr:receptor-mediated endocytosis protein 6 homolog isoform X1 [Frankliniella occidentalis]